ncbi:MAG: tetratricopeptide repeat protein [Acidobacteriota bacterium]
MSGRNMITSLLLLCVMLSLSLAGMSAQTAPAMPPDRKAFTDAARIKEPDKKIEAIEKVIADFPKSQNLYSMHQAIFETLVKSYPDQKDRILASANKAIETAPEFAKGFVCSSLGNKLLEAGILLDDAEQIVKRGLAFSEEALAKQKKQQESGYYATLGRIYVKQGKLKEAETILNRAREMNPLSSSASLGLAELYVKRGDDKLALDAYSTAAVSSKLSAESRKQLETLYSKSNAGSPAGLEEVLDKKYAQLFPIPVKVEHYKPSAKRTTRTALAEVFTGSGCPPCAAADLGFDAMMERYGRNELTVLMYHLHIPAPDPMTNPSTQSRGKFYAIQGVPAYAIDGKQGGGGGSREMTQGFYDRVNPDVEKQLETAAEADLKLDASMDGSTVKAKATVSNVKSDSANLKLHIVLAEEKLRFSGENGIRFHPMVVRSIAGPEYGGFAITAKDNQSFDWAFDVNAISAEAKKHLDEYEKAGHRGEPFTFSEKKDKIDPENLTVVAFVQDEKTKAILQTTLLKLKRPLASNNNR